MLLRIITWIITEKMRDPLALAQKMHAYLEKGLHKCHSPESHVYASEPPGNGCQLGMPCTAVAQAVFVRISTLQ